MSSEYYTKAKQHEDMIKTAEKIVSLMKEREEVMEKLERIIEFTTDSDMKEFQEEILTPPINSFGYKRYWCEQHNAYHYSP